MKLAEALSIRKDLQTRISELTARLVNIVKIQEGDEPAEDPKDLLKELDSCLKQLEEYIYRINVTNMRTMCGKKTLTQLMAERDVLTKRVSVMQEVFRQASSSSHAQANRQAVEPTASTGHRDPVHQLLYRINLAQTG